MPIHPPGIPSFDIHPPSTAKDLGEPTEDAWTDMQRVLALIQDERHLTAHTLYLNVLERFEKYQLRHHDHSNSATSTTTSTTRHKSNSSSTTHQPRRFFHMPTSITHFQRHTLHQQTRDEEQWQRVQQVLQTQRSTFEKLESRCRIFRKAQQNLEIESDWTHASTHFGIRTYYRRETADDSLSIKLEGELSSGISLFELVCVLKEIDLHYKWAPFCSSSMTIADLDKLDTVGWFLVGLPNFGLARDGCFRAIGCDNMLEDGSVLLVGTGIQDTPPGKPLAEETYLRHDPILEKLDIPPVPKRRGAGRMTIRKFEAVMHVTSATSAKTKLVANIDPNISFLPNTLLEFIMKHLAGVVLGKMQHAALKISKDPIHNEHAKRMRQEKDFYEGWLMKKFEHVCEIKGWTMPPIKALELSPDEVAHEQRVDNTTRRGVSFQEPRHVANLKQEALQKKNPTLNTSDSLLENDDGSTWSGLSVRSSRSTRSNNPLSAFFKESKNKQERVKLQAEQESRRRANEKLKPRGFSEIKQHRLEELKSLKQRRLARLSKEATTSFGSDNEVESFSERITYWLHSHGPLLRVTVVWSIMLLLFLLLHPRLIARVCPDFFEKSFPHCNVLLQNLFAAAYMLVSTFVHFSLCDVSLVYTFETLDLGRKTGRHIKYHYSKNTRTVVAASSMAMLGISVLKPIIKKLFRWQIWHVYQIYGTFTFYIGSPLLNATQNLPFMFPGSIGRFMVLFWKVHYKVVSWLTRLIARVALLSTNLIYSQVIRSNMIGRLMEQMFFAVYGALRLVYSSFSGFVTDSVDSRQGRLVLPSWHEEAFGTMQLLFTYTAIFLVISLILFSVYAGMTRRKLTVGSATQNNSSKVLITTDSSISLDNFSSDRDPQSLDGNLPSVAASIPEDEEFRDGLGSLPSTDVSISQGLRRRKKTFQRNKTRSSIESSPKALPSVVKSSSM